MGGGPRTFPGGLNKWQWKRLHEKKAREKEKRLLEQEKQVYQARIRSEIRAKLVSAENPATGYPKTNLKQFNYEPLSAKDHIRALADRFMKEGAEDLWNEADGPSDITIPSTMTSKSRITGKPIDMNARVSSFWDGEKHGKLVFPRNMPGNLDKPRRFSTCTRWIRYLASDSEHEYLRNSVTEFTSSFGSRRGMLKDVSCFLNFSGYCSVTATRQRLALTKPGDSSNFKASSGFGPIFGRNEMGSSDEEELETREDARRIVGSGAALRNYDEKTEK